MFASARAIPAGQPSLGPDLEFVGRASRPPLAIPQTRYSDCAYPFVDRIGKYIANGRRCTSIFQYHYSISPPHSDSITPMSKPLSPDDFLNLDSWVFRDELEPYSYTHTVQSNPMPPSLPRTESDPAPPSGLCQSLFTIGLAYPYNNLPLLPRRNASPDIGGGLILRASTTATHHPDMSSLDPTGISSEIREAATK